MSENITDSAELEFIDAQTAKFAITANQILTLELNGKFYPSVQLHRSFPFSNPDMYISVRDDDDSDKDVVREIGNDKKIEIGIIKNINDFDDATKKLLNYFLDLRYFAPSILGIDSVKEEFGFRYWTVETDKGQCKFTTTLARKNIVFIGSCNTVMIYDVDGNRFKVENYSQCDSKIRKQLEMFM